MLCVVLITTGPLIHKKNTYHSNQDYTTKTGQSLNKEVISSGFGLLAKENIKIRNYHSRLLISTS